MLLLTQITPSGGEQHRNSLTPPVDGDDGCFTVDVFGSDCAVQGMECQRSGSEYTDEDYAKDFAVALSKVTALPVNSHVGDHRDYEQYSHYRLLFDGSILEQYGVDIPGMGLLEVRIVHPSDWELQFPSNSSVEVHAYCAGDSLPYDCSYEDGDCEVRLFATTKRTYGLGGWKSLLDQHHNQLTVLEAYARNFDRVREHYFARYKELNGDS